MIYSHAKHQGQSVQKIERIQNVDGRAEAIALHDLLMRSVKIVQLHGYNLLWPKVLQISAPDLNASVVVFRDEIRDAPVGGK